MLTAASCASDSSGEQDVVDLRHPMTFGAPVATEQQQAEARRTTTRAAALESRFDDFKVGTWKYFGSANENVMNDYKVEHLTTPVSNGPYHYSWDYVGVNSQTERYWDLAAFPYEFRAVAPYNTTSTITPEGLSINASFLTQTLNNDVLSVSDATAEPCVVANVSREKDGSDYKDTDKLKDLEINTVGKSNATREVHMPFHHLVSKVGFQIYIDNPMPTSTDYMTDYGVWIDNITITLQKDGLITGATTYTATNAQGLLNGTWGGTTTTSAEHTILFHNAYNDASEQNLHEHLSPETAFDLTKDKTLQQIPQEGVKIHVVMDIHTNHILPTETQFHYDSWLSFDKTNTTGDLFTWLPDYRYIYRLHIPNLHGHEIELQTCEILPWDDVQTSDIQIEL